MNNYHIFLLLPCKDSKGNTDCYQNTVSLYEKIKCNNEQELLQIEHDGIPPVLLEYQNHFCTFVHPKINCDDSIMFTTKDKKNISQLGIGAAWVKLLDNPGIDTLLKTMSEKTNEFVSRECSHEDMESCFIGSAKSVSEQLHHLADNLPTMHHKLDIYWTICEHSECVNISNLIPVYGALKRLQMWNNASITMVFDLEKDLCHRSCEPWLKGLDITLTNLHETTDSEMIAKHYIAWTGSVTCVGDKKVAKPLHSSEWILSRTDFSLESSKSCVDRTTMSDKQTHEILDNSITIVCEVTRQDIPLWKILPFKFILYHKTLTKRVIETERLTKLYDEVDELDSIPKETVLLGSIKSYTRTTLSASLDRRKTEDWIEFVETGVTKNHGLSDKTVPKEKKCETFYCVLYPIEPGIFDVFFMRPEASFCHLSSIVAVHEASSLPKSKRTAALVLPKISYEKQWLKYLDDKSRVTPSPGKVQFSLAVLLDASEMLKHFSKDGKPLKKELEELKKQVEEKKTCSSTETENENPLELDGEVNVSQELLPKHVQHETLSICNTPKTLAKARSQATKRKAAPGSEKKMADDVSANVANQASSCDKMTLNPKTKKPKLSTKTQNNVVNKVPKGKITKEEKIPLKTDTTAGDSSKPTDDVNKTKKKKRRSFDGTETSLAPANAADTKEKRSDRHKRRLARVVRRALIKYGVDTKESYFETCSERLYYLCKSFLKDLKTSEGLNNEMKRLADSNVANVVEFEKRRWETGLAKEKT